MALIDCPSCRKKISSKATTCTHCNFNLKQASSDDVLRKEKLTKFKHRNGIQTQSMLAMLLFIGGFAFMYWGDTRMEDTQYKVAVVAAVAGFCWYVACRIRLILLKIKENQK